MNRTRLLTLLAAASLAAAGSVDPKNYQADVNYLASPELKGRATGSPELEKAADFIARKFKSFGLKPDEQPFPVITGAHLGPKNSLDAFPSSDFQPFSFSSSGSITAPVVFAGYGITNPDVHYDDYSGIDVTGKIVLILRHEPKEPKELSTYSALAEKAVNAKMHGAKGVLLVNDIYAHGGEDKGLDKFGVTAGPTDAGIFFVQVKPEVAEKMLGPGKLRELTEQPRSFALDGPPLALSVDIRRESKTVHNVTAYLRGQTDEYVIIGAHYDHLGLGDEHSLAPSQIGTIHPGADDNASGTAGVIELARWFTKQPKPKRGILFMTFAGEELGLLGSGFYVNNPTMPLDKAVTMINMDMIGRIRDGKVYIGGTGTGSTFDQLLSSVHAPAPINIIPSEKTGYGSSDHTSFTTKSIPTLFFFSGLHGDYHKPSDTADKIDAGDAAKLLDYIAQLAVHLENDASRPQFVRVAEPSMPSGSSGGGSGYGPNFGSIPDFNEPPKGVRFADVRDGTPAAKAGLKAGDILIEFDGKEIGNLYDFTYALRAHKPGDLVLVKVIRGTQTIEAKVLLTERK
ncbi:MAG: M28 family peptidase [Acidobacteriia bacterium]|nr:M28 family peptidase [Terriglobia bacterium]